MISDEIERLIQLRNSGALTEEEFLLAKQQVLNGPVQESFPFVQQPANSAAVDAHQICGIDSRIWCTLMHAAQLLTWTGVGIVAPLVMWLMSKDQSREANRHGLVILNWMLSSLVYFLFATLACFLVVGVVIGVPMFIVLVALNIIFPIIGAVYASGGTLWRYPLTINFFDAENG